MNWDELQQLRARKREEDAEWRKQQREEKARTRAEEHQGTTDGAGDIVAEDGDENGEGGWAIARMFIVDDKSTKTERFSWFARRRVRVVRSGVRMPL